MYTIEEVTQRVQLTRHGFTDILRASNEIIENHPQPLVLAQALWELDIHQARMLATYLFGRQAATSPEILDFMRHEVSHDPNWRVQEILAQAIDQYAKDYGYENALPVMQAWLADEHPNVRRAVTEGLRIWTNRPYFKHHPEVAIQMLSALHADASDYVRKSVGNALRDISRHYPDLIQAELTSWDICNKYVRQVHKLASKFIPRQTP